MNNDKPLREMSPDEIAELKPEQFQELAHDHNDYLELKENARQRQLDDSWPSHDQDLHQHEESEIDGIIDMTNDNEETLPNPDQEIDEVLQGLLKDRPNEPPSAPDRKTLVQSVVGAVKEWRAQKNEDRLERSAEQRTPAEPTAAQQEIRAKREAAREQDIQGATPRPPQSRDRW